MANVISFSIFELFTFLSFFFSIVSMIILTYIIIRRRNILAIAKKRVIKKTQIKASQGEAKLNVIVQAREKEIRDLKLNLQKYKEAELNFMREINLFEENIDTDYISLLNRLKDQVSKLESEELKPNLKGLNLKTDTDKIVFINILKKKHPFLTEQEITLCTYFRNNLPSKDIAQIEGITDGTVRVYKNKIKNKIGLAQIDSLNEYLVNIPIRKTA